ncbi:MAG: hypothetical protein ACYDCQ_14175 [Dehalococcoidia bacterium]
MFADGVDPEGALALLENPPRSAAFGSITSANEPRGRDPPVLDLLASLVEHNLLLASDLRAGEPRFQLSQTVREYALECLQAHGDERHARDAHLRHVLALAEAAEPGLKGAEQFAWSARLESRLDDICAALDWAARSGDVERQLRLTGSLGWFCLMRGHLNEGRVWLLRALGNGGTPRERHPMTEQKNP